MEDLISVIVPVYKVEKYLRKCVDSILCQTYPRFELILVDDGSPDGCGAICDEYAAGDPRVRVIHKPNGGLSSARNVGIDAAKGDYLYFVDSDDWLEPEALMALIEAVHNYDVPISCIGNYDVNIETGEKTLGICPKKEEVISGEEMVGRIFTWDGCDSAVCDKLFRRELFRERRFPVGKICEDIPVTYRILLEAGRIAMVDKPLYNYLRRPGSLSNGELSETSFHFSEHTKEIYSYIREHHPAVLPQAEFFRVRSLAHILFKLDMARPEERAQYAKRHQEARRAMRKHIPFILGCPRFDNRERLRCVLLSMGVYSILRPLFTRDNENTL